MPPCKFLQTDSQCDKWRCRKGFRLTWVDSTHTLELLIFMKPRSRNVSELILYYCIYNDAGLLPQFTLNSESVYWCSWMGSVQGPTEANSDSHLWVILCRLIVTNLCCGRKLEKVLHLVLNSLLGSPLSNYLYVAAGNWIGDQSFTWHTSTLSLEKTHQYNSFTNTNLKGTCYRCVGCMSWLTPRR